MNEYLEDHLTFEFLNDLEIFDYDEFVRQYIPKPKPKPKPSIEIFCMEFDPNLSKKEFECAICMETQIETESVVLKCKHKFCYSCISSYMQHKKHNLKSTCCALCRESFTTMEFPDYNNLLSMMEILHDNH